jgi:DNA-3-methyladenine glycosylase II
MPSSDAWSGDSNSERGAAEVDSLRFAQQHRQVFLIHPISPFRLDLTVWALRRRPENLIDRWDGKTYSRTLVIGGAPFTVAVRQARPDAPLCIGIGGPEVDPNVGKEIRRKVAIMLGVREDLAAFYRLAEQDRRLAPLVEKFKGVKPPRFPSVFEGLVNGIACQQLSLTVGIRLLNRLAERFGRRASRSEASGPAFPRPEELAAAKPEEIRQLGFNRRKAETIIGISQDVMEGRLDLEGLQALNDEEAVRRLVELRGIGRWTAEYTLLRGMGRWHIFPVGDQGALNGLARWLRLRVPIDTVRAQRLLARWKPYSGLMYFHMLMNGLDETGWLRLPYGEPGGQLVSTPVAGHI